MKEKSVGHCNKPGNKDAQAVGKNCQNILDAGELVIQRSTKEVTGKVQKYARMGARQFVPHSYGELTIENTKEAGMRHFTGQFQLGKNVAGDVSTIEGMYPVRSFRDKMTSSPLISTRISFFQSFGVQMVHYIIYLVWYIKLIQLSDFVVHASVSEMLPGPTSSISTALRTSSTVTFFSL